MPDNNFPHIEPINVQVNKNLENDHHIDENIKSSHNQINKLNEHSNAVIWQDSMFIEEQIQQVKSLKKNVKIDDLKLLGVPILIKEIDSSIAGTPNSWGNFQLKQENYCDTFTSTNITKLKNAGAVIMGKTNNPELALTVTTQSRAHGPCNNPIDTSRNSGGSSGGSAAAVASAMTSVALGSDGGGSIRIPASACGVFGFKPSRDVISLGPIIDEAWGGLVCKGLISSNIEDLTAVLNIISEPQFQFYINKNFHDSISSLKIGIRYEGFSNLYPINPDIKATVELFGKYLSSLGAEVSVASPVAYEDESIRDVFLDMIAYNIYQDVELSKLRLKEPFNLDLFENETKFFYEMGKKIQKNDYLNSKEKLKSFSRCIFDWHEQFDLLITPTTGDVAPLHGAVEKDPDMAPFIYGGLCFPSNISGAPALSIPIKNSMGANLPIGIQIIGQRGKDNLVLDTGYFCNSDYSDIFVTQIYDITT